MESVRHSGFKTTGAPEWIWHTASTAVLNKLRKSPPKSGLAITELALEKYTLLDKQIQDKQELKKKFKQAAQEINSGNWKEYIDPETGIVCKTVAPSEEKFKVEYIPPAPPENYCFVCGDPVYFYEQPDLCIWCAEKF